MVEPFVHTAIVAMWIAWIAYWMVAARRVKRTRWEESLTAQAVHGVPILLCTLLLAVPARWQPAALTAPLVPSGEILPVAGALLVMAGLALAVWARTHLGANWSSRVVVKEDHALVRTGPYGKIRHPIYSGLLLALAGTAIALAEWRGVFAFLFALLAILFRVRAEEARMAAVFPEYASYRQGSWALLPGLF